LLGWQWWREQAERREAVRIAAEGDFQSAEPRLLALAQRHPNDATVAKTLALGYLKANQLAAAEPFFARWCAASSGDPEPYDKRIGLWLSWDRLRDAVVDARRVLELQPGNQKLHQHLPRWLLITGQFDEAEQECQRFLQRWPGDPWVLLIYALACQRQGRAQEAAVVVDRLIQEYTDFHEAFVIRGTLYLDMDQPKEAIPWLRRAAASAGPHRREALYELGRALNRIGESKEAEQVMAQARLLQEQDFLKVMARETGGQLVHVNVQARLAEEMLTAGKSDEALGLLTRILNQDPNCAAAHRVLAAYYEKQGQPELAAEHRRRESATP
jgi:tetratricopeptide (TPR) repeat protein